MQVIWLSLKELVEAVWVAANAQLTTQLVALLFLIEAATWACVLMSPESRQNRRMGWLQPSLWALMPLMGFVGVTLVAIVLPGVTTRISMIVGGIVLFVSGWSLRYGRSVDRRLVPLVARWNQEIARLIKRSPFLRSAVRHPRYVGLELEAVGLVLLTSSPWALAVLPLLAAVTYLAVQGQERSFIRAHPNSGWHLHRRETHALYPGPVQTLQLIAPALGFGVVTAIVIGEFHVATTADASELAQGLITIQTVLGLLPLTFAVSLAEIAASSYSTRVVQAIALDRRVWQAFTALVMSLAIDILILARPSLAATYPLADFAIIVAVLASLRALWVTKELGGYIGPQGVMQRALRSLTLEWATAVSQIFAPSRSTQGRELRGDPFYTVERLLARWAKEDDAGAFHMGLDLLLRRIDEMFGKNKRNGGLEYRGVSAEDEAGLDTYLTRRLGALIERSASEGRAWVLGELLGFRWRMEPQTLRLIPYPDDPGRATVRHEEARIVLTRRAFGGAPLGACFFTKILEEAIINELDDTGQIAAYRIRGLATRAIANLPKEEDIPLLRSFRGHSEAGISSKSETRENDSDDLRQNDDFLRSVQDGLIRYVRERGVEAVKLGLPKTASALDFVLASCVAEIHSRVTGVVLRRGLLRAALFSIDRIAQMAAKQRMTGVTDYPELRDGLEAGNPEDQELAEMLAEYGARIITRAAQNGILDFGLILKISHTAWEMVKAYPGEAGRLALAMHTAAEALPDDTDQESFEGERDWLRESIYERIAGIRRHAGDAREALDEALGGLPAQDLEGEELRQALLQQAGD